jgi:uncharacterized protein
VVGCSMHRSATSTRGLAMNAYDINHVIEVFERHNVEYVVVGATAGILHGAPVDEMRTRDIDTDVEWTETAGFPLAGTYRTPEGVTTNVMEKLASEWEDWTVHDDTYVVDGEDVVVLARYTARHQATRKPLDVRVAHHFVVRDGLIVRFEQFVDTALVRDAAS